MRQKKSSADIMLRNLLGMIVTITLLLGIVIIIAVGKQLLTEANNNSANVINSLKKAEIDGDDDWENWRKNSTIDTSSSYVYVNNARKDAKVKYYYSPDAHDLLAVKPRKLPIFANIYYRQGRGLLLRRTGHARGIHYTLWQSLDYHLEVLERVIEATIAVLVVTLIATPFYVRRLTRRLTDPLTTLSESTQVAAAATEPGSMQLPVPEQPAEVTELANNFNVLLKLLGERQEQQKLFVMNAAHELRTPIATIRSHAQLIERRAAEHPEIVAKSVHYITEESRLMQQLLEQLLQISRADRSVADAHPLDLSATVTGITQKLAGTMTQTLQVQIAPGVQVLSSEVAIEQIAGNLLTNAAKYSPADSEVTVTLKQDGSNCVLTVSDQGAGISDEDKAHIFERFYRSADVRGSIPGTGLGLAIADRLAQNNGGHLEVADNQPQGASFRLILPLLRTSPDAN
ncbi:MAG: HAMP domain-containing histidine kinase [Lacticaseibacillus songhuajiangensis]|jgi:signal transduction histidine kinase|nr:HAMP domain-containing histidine kinase [Lacticaseibacillus songhuajiangensis]